ncbi:MAG: glutamate--tRNA ligase, partial [Candidatus Dormibacteraeota bacterium]|nr:glutamate--tRNA ligase [Candidatus Dormibacteraeota bacterium]
SILEGIRWLGLEWDEGPEVGGPYAPYFQSERLPLYRAAAQRLVEAGHAYYCFCTPERLAALRKEQERTHLPTRYDGHCRDLDPSEVRQRHAAGEAGVVRMRIPEGRTTVDDLLRGRLEFDNATLDDQVLLKSDGFPTYHLAATVDDHEMAMTHVIRGEEWLPSTPKHVLLYQVMGWDPPTFVHLPLVLGPDRAKLSKRHGAAALLEYRDMGYLPEAMNNFLAFLGWSPGTGEELFDLDGLVVAFELEKVQSSPAVFDQAKLDSVNAEHIRRLTPDELSRRLRPFVPTEITDDLLAQATPLVQTRITKLNEAADLVRFFVARPREYPDGLVPKGTDPAEAAGVLAQARAVFAAGRPGPVLEAALREVATKHGWKAGDLFMALRVAIIGSRQSLPLLESSAILERDEVLARLDAAVASLDGAST